RPRSSTVPTSAMVAPSTPTSPTNVGRPVPSAIVAPRITRSCIDPPRPFVLPRPCTQNCARWPGKTPAGVSPASNRDGVAGQRLGWAHVLRCRLDDAQRTGEGFEPCPRRDVLVLGEEDELRRAGRVTQQLEQRRLHAGVELDEWVIE